MAREVIQMENTQKEIFVNEIKRLQNALYRTRSPYLKRDYQKAIKRNQRALREFERYQREARA